MENQENETAGQELRRYREDLDLTQAVFGARVEVTKKCISNIERGNASPGLELATRIYKLTGIRPERWVQRPGESA